MLDHYQLDKLHIFLNENARRYPGHLEKVLDLALKLERNRYLRRIADALEKQNETR